MRLSTLILISLFAYGRSLPAQEITDDQLARDLANERTRQNAITRIVAMQASKVQLLLLWTKSTPPQVDSNQLRLGLIEVFGELRTREAIPFLIENLSLRTWPGDPWLKSREVVESTFPAAAALIRIGSEASKALIRAYGERMAPVDRLVALFAIGRIADPDSRSFLSFALAEADVAQRLTHEGLKALDPKE